MKKFAATQHDSLFAMEEAILRFWQKDGTFQKSLAKNPVENSFSFYDGPPFITGLPHYATLLPSIAKDIIPRYQTMKGKHVERIWGWDCHGLPAENQVEKQLGLKTKKDIETLGVDKFVAACRAYVGEVSGQWRWYIDHIGRWVDLDNAYRTDQLSYMESVLWAFRQLYDQGLIYQGRRVSLYCPRCATPLSKFEITMDEGNYRDVEDPAVTVAFKATEVEEYFLAWTTTPWTLPANLALAVNPKIEYVRATDGKHTYILAHLAMERYGSDLDLEIIETFPGAKLVGRGYEPLYHFFETNSRDYKIYAGEFVNEAEGTGLVHIAPGFGEDDTALGETYKLSLALTVNDEGHYTEQMGPWRGLYYKKTNPLITADLKKRGLIVREETITHAYPHCYRCGTALIYKSQVSWYLKVERIREQLIEKNTDINWLPKHFGPGRFTYNLESAPDWALSRTRYWGTPVPVWQTEDGQTIVPGSIKELEELSGQKITDLHRPNIDKVVITAKNGQKAHRVKEVLDVWFESGSMPYGQRHYPFEHEAEFTQSFPADFIIEYTGQLRGWFYYLHLLANALKGQNAFRNVAVTGVLMGTDGRKMSKSYGNYPDPKATIEKYGAEALRLYFMGSKIMDGEDLVMNEEALREQSRLLQVLHNSFRYFLTYANLHNFSARGLSSNKPTASRHILDRWIILRLEETLVGYSEALDQFNFVQATNSLRPFIEDLSTWYIRRSRERFVRGEVAAFQTLYEVLLKFSLLIAPTLPFSAEYMYQSLTGSPDSVHLQDYPTPQPVVVQEHSEILEQMELARQVVNVAHRLRAEMGHSLRQPLATLDLVGYLELKENPEILVILASEVNVAQVTFNSQKPRYQSSEVAGNRLISLDGQLTSALKEEGAYRELVRVLQDARKKAGLAVGEKVTLHYATASKPTAALVAKYQEKLIEDLSLKQLTAAPSSENLTPLASVDLAVRFSR